MGTDCSGRWHFCELCCLLGINGSKTAAVCIATDRKAAHLCQGVGEMGGGVSLFVFEMGEWFGPGGHQQVPPPLPHPAACCPPWVP